MINQRNSFIRGFWGLADERRLVIFVEARDDHGEPREGDPQLSLVEDDR